MNKFLINSALLSVAYVSLAMSTNQEFSISYLVLALLSSAVCSFGFNVTPADGVMPRRDVLQRYKKSLMHWPKSDELPPSPDGWDWEILTEKSRPVLISKGGMITKEDWLS